LNYKLFYGKVKYVASGISEVYNVRYMADNKNVAVFGGGCFWCAEAVFAMLEGVLSVVPGYAGGTVTNPSYEQVCGGKTGHAEVIRIEYDPGKISYNDLLTVFFATHDPTTPDRQGNDVGTQYRSSIFYTTDAQRMEAAAYIKEINGSEDRGAAVVTEIKSLNAFYPAEEYHKRYYEKNPRNAYCQVVINPKMRMVQEKFARLLKRKK